MLRETPAMTVRNNLGELLNEVQYRHDSVLITKGGKPVAALVNVEMFQRIRAMEGEFNRLTDRLATAYSGVDETEAQAEIAEALAAARDR
ncbi:type II toxin-antitoxin system Phd/YefM family antitoxin [Endothiovibrio diazotrophicus]